MQLTEKYSTTLSMLPVCECGTVIPDVEVQTPDKSWLAIHIYPNKCPNCGAYIDGLQMDGKYVELFIRRLT